MMIFVFYWIISFLLDHIQPIHMSRDRSRQKDANTTAIEQSQMRATLGNLSWTCGHVDFVHSADVGFLISTVPHSKVSDILKLNKLIANVKHSPTKLKINAMPKDAPVDLVAWDDATWANRPDQSRRHGTWKWSYVFAERDTSVQCLC